MSFFLARLREPSTLAGLAALVAMFGAPAGLAEGVAQLVAGGAAIAAVLMPEGRR